VKLKLVSALVLCLAIVSQSAGPAHLEEIWKPAEEGWFDLDLTVTSVTDEGDYITVVGMGLFRGNEVGLKVGFRKGMRPAMPNAQPDRTAFAHNGIACSSIGEASDRLLKAMATLYDVPAPAGKFASRVDVTAIALEQYPIDVTKNATKFKVFFNDGAGQENDYAELYTNIDIPGQRLELHEKDPEYRANVVRALVAP
jgi:hypothetical protein